jgi:subfamily B ATP-binding cassette protein MsbA
MVCVVVSNLFDALVLPLIALSISLILAAAPISAHVKEKTQALRDELHSEADKIAPTMGLDQKAVERAFDRIQNQIAAAKDQNDVAIDTLTAELLAKQIKKPVDDIKSALTKTGFKPKGDIDAVKRLAWVSCFVVLLFACRYWFIRGQIFYLSRASTRLTSDLRERLFTKLQRLPVSYFSEKRAGEIQSVLTNDVNVYSNAVNIIRDSIEAPVRITISLGYVIITEWRLALVAACFLPLMVVIINRNSRKMKRAQSKVQDDLAELSAVTTEALLGTRVIKAFSAEQRVEAFYKKHVESSYQSQMWAARTVASLRPMVELTGACSLAAVLVASGLLSYINELNLGTVAALLLALDRVNQSLKSIGAVASTYKQVEAASDRIHTQVLDVPDQVLDHGAGKTLANVQGRIEFKNVTFRYPDGTEALRNVSFTIEPGTSLALVGPSGAGKSTIADLLLRFYDPSEGQILMDGVDLRELKIQWVRQQIGVVPQQTFLFAGTVSENIRMGKEDASDAEVLAACKAAYADEFIVHMDEGYSSQLGESGIRLSGGQRQRIAIARALVRQPAVLLLDEATSALDATSEKAVNEALDVIMKERTSLFIAHRLTTAARADRILVLRKGEVIETGSHTELMEQGGAYAGLFRAFSGGLLE